MPRGTLSRSRSRSNPSFVPNADLELDLLARQQTTHSTRSNEDETATTQARPSRYDSPGKLSVTGRTSTQTSPSPAPRSAATSSLYRWEGNNGRSASEISSTLPYGDPLLQLEAVDTLPGAQISLPSSRPSLFGSVSSLISALTVPDSLEQLNHGQPVAPSDIPLPAISRLSLPYSPAGSFETGSSRGNMYVEPDSLEQLHRLHPADPSEISLPESNSSGFVDVTDSSVVSSSVVSSCNGPPRILTPDKRENYWQRIRPLTRFMPHLRDIFPPSTRRQYAGKVTCLDYFPKMRSPRVGHEIDMKIFSDREIAADRVEDMRVIQDPAVTSRIIMVEDLCSELIEMLGTAFGLDPELFAEHLNRAGYNVNNHNEVDAAQWNTSHLKRDSVSLTWCRPVYQNPLLADSLGTPRRLSNEEPDSTDGTLRMLWRLDPVSIALSKRNHLASGRFLKVKTNIFRKSWSLSAGTAGLDFEPDEPLHEVRSTLVPTAWQERASFCFIDGDGPHGSIPIGILLLDPLPEITDIQPTIHTRGDVEARPQENAVIVEIALPMASRLPINAPLNKYTAHDAEVRRLERSFTDLRSTSWYIQNAGHPTRRTSHSGGLSDPILVLLRIVEQDTRVFLWSLELALDDIRNDSLDEFLLTRHLSYWRRLMNEFEKEVPAISARLEHFVHFVFGSDDGRPLPKEVEDIVRAVNQEVARVKVRLNEAYDDLRVDMQFNESRRSLTETQSVTRLTELAFAFIPLSFCASLFSMSIQELDNGVPVWIFIITSIAMVTLAYSVRILVGNDPLVNNTRRFFARLWKRIKDPAIATSLAMTASVAIPAVFMWTSTNMDKGFKTGVTFLLVSIAASPLLLSLSERSSGWSINKRTANT